MCDGSVLPTGDPDHADGIIPWLYLPCRRCERVVRMPNMGRKWLNMDSYFCFAPVTCACGRVSQVCYVYPSARPDPTDVYTSDPQAWDVAFLRRQADLHARWREQEEPDPDER